MLSMYIENARYPLQGHNNVEMEANNVDLGISDIPWTGFRESECIIINYY